MIDLIGSRVFQSLYAPETQGFDRAIDFGEKFRNAVRKTNADQDAQGRLAFYLACAYGQKARATTDVAERAPLRQKALAAAQDAIDPAAADGPKWKDELRAVWNPDPDTIDDDLTVFRDDPDFIALLT
ncbi:MAG: hypothetical protein HY290_29520 [Planctomycetia bacterium]|nr:hypothetical protein [Planctomycetia bacterium]